MVTKIIGEIILLIAKNMLKIGNLRQYSSSKLLHSILRYCWVCVINVCSNGGAT